LEEKLNYHLKTIFDIRHIKDEIRDRRRALYAEIEGIDSDKLNNSSVEDLNEEVCRKYKFQPIQLITEEIQIEGPEDARIPRVDMGPNGLGYRTGIGWWAHIPYTGERKLFSLKPSHVRNNIPKAHIADDKLILFYKQLEADEDAVETQLDNDLAIIQEHLDRLDQDISKFNESIENETEKRIIARKDKLAKAIEAVGKFKYPIKRREVTPKIVEAPINRKPIAVPKPTATEQHVEDEYVLDMAVYDDILSVISSMALVIERNPSVFKGWNEEALRTAFLIPLNAQFEGSATAETFNCTGKTDILIRVKDKNIFIAECKFYHGPKAISAAIDQLLNYVTWRDSKTALLIFHRSKNFSEVLGKIHEATLEHPQCKEEIKYDSSMGYRFKLKHPTDLGKELFLTVLAFVVPD